MEVVDVSDPDNPAHVCIRKTGESQSNRYRDGYLYSGEWGERSRMFFGSRASIIRIPVSRETT